MEHHDKTAEHRHRIIIIDDNLAIHDDFRKILVNQSETDTTLDDMESLLFGAEKEQHTTLQYEIEYASQGKEGLEKVRQARAEGRPYSLAFVDGRMPPGWDGIETISHLWKACPDLQVVLCTAYADYSWQEIQQVLGESDSLLILKKPFDNVEVLQLAHALTRKWELNREIMGRLNQLAFYDHLTGLPNRALFKDRLTLALEYSQRYKHKGALLFLDLDNFKRINDTLGHSVGDDLLKAMGKRILKSLRESDTVSRPTKDEIAARLGGDEFTVVLPQLDHLDDAALVARRIEEHLSQPLTIGNHEFIITASIGIAVFPDDGINVETLLKNADLAMYFAKNSGQGQFKYYQQSMNDAALKRLTIENQLRQAIERDELALHYQPQMDLPSGRLIGFEALIRWNNKELGNIPPLEFIPVAEDTGLIIMVGEWVLRTACKQMKKWLEERLPVERIAVNVSVKQFTHPGFVAVVEDVLASTQLPPSCLEIEITESLLAQELEQIISILRELQSKNIHIAVDDFGTGYSSFSRLKEMPIDCLKIDRSFIQGIEKGENDQSIITAITAMAKAMGLRVIAEGVDSDQQLQFLIEKDCQEAQGYLFSRPLPVDKIEKLLQKLQSEPTATGKTGK